MPLSVDPQTILSLTALRNAGVVEAEFREDGTLSRAKLAPPATDAEAAHLVGAPAKDAEPIDRVREGRRSNYENLFDRPVDDTELDRLP